VNNPINLNFKFIILNARSSQRGALFDFLSVFIGAFSGSVQDIWLKIDFTGSLLCSSEIVSVLANL